MMSKPNNSFDQAVNEEAALAMTLYDYFAGQAIAGLLAASDSWYAEELAVRAYEVADAMVEHRLDRDIDRHREYDRQGQPPV